MLLVYFGSPIFPPAGFGGDVSCLIRSDSSRHPFFGMLEKFIAQNNQEFGPTPDFDQPQVKHITKDRG
jgi:hypothetical protein